MAQPTSRRPPARAGTSSARGGAVLPPRDASEVCRPDPRAPRAAAARQAMAGHPAAGTEACHRAADRPDSPPRAPRGRADDRAARDSRAWSGPLAPSGERDAPGRPPRRSPGSGNRGPGGAAPAVAPEELSASGRRSPRPARRRRAASPPGLHRTPGAGTFPRERVPRPRGRTGRLCTIYGKVRSAPPLALTFCGLTTGSVRSGLRSACPLARSG